MCVKFRVGARVGTSSGAKLRKDSPGMSAAMMLISCNHTSVRLSVNILIRIALKSRVRVRVRARATARVGISFGIGLG